MPTTATVRSRKKMKEPMSCSGSSEARSSLRHDALRAWKSGLALLRVLQNVNGDVRGQRDFLMRIQAIGVSLVSHMECMLTRTNRAETRREMLGALEGAVELRIILNHALADQFLGSEIGRSLIEKNIEIIRLITTLLELLNSKDGTEVDR